MYTVNSKIIQRRFIMSKKNIPQQYKESKEARYNRVVNEGGKFRQRIVTSKKVYNRKKNKKEESYDNH